MNKIEEMLHEDYIAEGWKKVDPKLINPKPPKIKWGMKFMEWNDHQKIKYLEQLCFSMNYAVDTIQKERNQLNDLCFKKEAQLEKMKDAITKNMQMLQGEVKRMNEDRQIAIKNFTAKNKQIKRLNEENKELRSKIKELT